MKAEVLPPARYVYRNLVVRAKKLTRPFCLSVTALYFVALLASASREGSTTNFSVLHLGDEDHHAEVVARFAARVPSSDEQHTTTDRSKPVKVSSSALYSASDSKIFPGNFYCKLLSPAKVVEWIQTTGLTKRFS